MFSADFERAEAIQIQPDAEVFASEVFGVEFDRALVKLRRTGELMTVHSDAGEVHRNGDGTGVRSSELSIEDPLSLLKGFGGRCKPAQLRQ